MATVSISGNSLLLNVASTGQPWATAPVPDASGGPTNGVTFIVTPGGGTTNSVQATIGSGEADGTGKLFGRLRADPP